MLLATVPSGYLQVVLPLYLNRAGLEPSLIGLLYSLSGLVTAGLVAFSGVLADRFGRRGFLILGTCLPIASYAIFAATTEPGWPVVASLLGGVGLGLGVAVQLLPLWFALRFGADEVALGPWYAAAQVLSLSSVVLSPWLDRRLGGAMAVLGLHLVGGACLLVIALLSSTFQLAAI